MLFPPKNKKRRIANYKANRSIIRRRLGISHEEVHALNIPLLKKFVSLTGRIFPRNVTGASAKMHRRITKEIKRARALNLLR